MKHGLTRAVCAGMERSTFANLSGAVVARLVGTAVSTVASTLAAFALSASCALFDSGATVVLPGCPASWLGSRAAGARFDVYEADSGGMSLAASGATYGERIEIGSSARGMRAFLAYPIARGAALRPAGAFLPIASETPPSREDPRPASIALGFEDGWIASFAAVLIARAPLAAEAFDWKRLAEEIEARGGDPWAVPPGEAAERVLAGTFSATFLNGMRYEETRLRAAGLGPLPAEAWICSSPFASVRVDEEEFVLSWPPRGGEELFSDSSRGLIRRGFDGKMEAFVVADAAVSGGEGS